MWIFSFVDGNVNGLCQFFFHFKIYMFPFLDTYASSLIQTQTKNNKKKITQKRWWKKTKTFRLPCRPTISATCSELGTGTHSVIFCDFFERSSRFGNIVVNALNPTLFDKTLFMLFKSLGLNADGDLLALFSCIGKIRNETNGN